jgi:hypothetical protein
MPGYMWDVGVFAFYIYPPPRGRIPDAPIYSCGMWSVNFLDLLIAFYSLGKLSAFAPSTANHSPCITSGTDYLHISVVVVIFIYFVLSALSTIRAEQLTSKVPNKTAVIMPSGIFRQ